MKLFKKDKIKLKVKTDTLELDALIEKMNLLKSLLKEVIKLASSIKVNVSAEIVETVPDAAGTVSCDLMVGDMVIGQLSGKRADKSLKNLV